MSYIESMRRLVPIMLAALATLVQPVTAGATAIVLKRGVSTDLGSAVPAKRRSDERGWTSAASDARGQYGGHEFERAKDAGFDFVRLTVDPAAFLVNRTPENTKQLLAAMRAAIADIRAAGLKVDVDLHSIPRDERLPGTAQVLGDDKLVQAYLEVVTDVGRELSAYPVGEVAFEPMNEPTIDCSNARDGAASRWPAMLKRLHDAARRAAPQTTLVLSGACWGRAEGLAAIDPAMVMDDNIIWSFHSYEPFVFSHQGASWTKDVASHVSGLAFPPVEGSKARIVETATGRIRASRLTARREAVLLDELHRYLNWYFRPGQAEKDATAPFVRVEAWARQHGIPASRIMLGEFGVIRGDTYRPLGDEARAPLIALVRTQAEARGYAWSCWSWSGSFGISRTATSREFSPVLLQALGLR